MSIDYAASGSESTPPRMTCTIEEAGQMLGIGRSAAYAAARRGEIPTIRIGRRLVVSLARLNDLLGETKEVTG